MGSGKVSDKKTVFEAYEFEADAKAKKLANSRGSRTGRIHVMGYEYKADSGKDPYAIAADIITPKDTNSQPKLGIIDRHFNVLVEIKDKDDPTKSTWYKVNKQSLIKRLGIDSEDLEVDSKNTCTNFEKLVDEKKATLRNEPKGKVEDNDLGLVDKALDKLAHFLFPDTAKSDQLDPDIKPKPKIKALPGLEETLNAIDILFQPHAKDDPSIKASFILRNKEHPELIQNKLSIIFASQENPEENIKQHYQELKDATKILEIRPLSYFFILCYMSGLDIRFMNDQGDFNEALNGLKDYLKHKKNEEDLEKLLTNVGLKEAFTDEKPRESDYALLNVEKGASYEDLHEAWKREVLLRKDTEGGSLNGISIRDLNAAFNRLKMNL